MEFVVICDHLPGDCPSSNAMVRKGMTESTGKLPALAKSLGIEIIFSGAPVVDHKLFFVLRASNQEAVRDFLVKSGIIQTNTSHVYPTVSVEGALQAIAELPPIY